MTNIFSACNNYADSVADPGGGRGGHGPPGPVKIGHKKDGHRRQPHRFHVSRPPPYPAAGSATETTIGLASDEHTEQTRLSHASDGFNEKLHVEKFTLVVGILTDERYFSLRKNFPPCKGSSLFQWKPNIDLLILTKVRFWSSQL